MARAIKLKVMISTTGRRPSIAAPTAMPTKPFSAIGVSTTRRSPNSFKRPAVILYDPSNTPISSPIKKTFSSRSISSRNVSCNACRKLISAILSLSLLSKVICRIYIIEEAFKRREWALFGEPDGRFNLLVDLCLDLVQALLVDQLRIQQTLRKDVHGIGRTATPDQIFVAIAIGVNDRVTTETEADRLNKARLMLLARKLDRRTDRVAHSQHVVAIHTFATHVKGAALAIQLGHGRSFISRHPHAKPVIDDEENDR